ncbi:carbohydrate sulfotransferase 10-like [Haliotis cracherodii]|uniref:carbohydrate sulfotransferase 10-like n=1 Tax=Haliotis cracherodii TaxID=6455 RepID=UPI0039EAFB26
MVLVRWLCARPRAFRRLRRAVVLAVAVIIFITVMYPQENTDSLHVQGMKPLKRTNHDHPSPAQRFEERRQRLERACRLRINLRPGLQPFLNYTEQMIVNIKSNISLCEIPKVGSMFWRSVLSVLAGKTDSFHSAFDKNWLTYLSSLPSNQIAQYTTTNKIVFVRNPFSRLLSAYVDKLFGPNPFYWNLVGKNIVQTVRQNPSADSLRCGHDVTFPELVRYLIIMDSKGVKFDSHFVPVSKHCSFCDTRYDFIGHVETFREDVVRIVNAVSQLKEQVNLSGIETGTDLQQLERNTYNVFGMRKERILKCMTFHEALLRLWRRWQMRGILHKSETFPVKKDQSNSVTFNEFHKMAVAAWNRSGSGSWKSTNRKEALIEAFSDLDPGDLEQLKAMFENDFLLFGYSRDMDVYGVKEADFKYFKLD